MNKYIIFVGLSLSCCSIQLSYTAENIPQTHAKNAILSGLAKTQISVFSKDDLFADSLQPQDWYRYLNEIKKYVADNSRGDQKLLCSLDTILEYNDTLITSIKVAYNGLFSDDKSFQDAMATSALQKFQQIMNAMSAEQKMIVKDAYIYKNKNDVREVLEQLALFTELNAQRASNNLRKRIAKQKP